MESLRQAVEEVIQYWPATSREAVETMIERYGEPDEYSKSQVIWHYNGPWRKTVVSAEEVPHDFPSHHQDVLEQFIDYQVPLDKFDALAKFDGSVIVERTKGVISARCAGEEMNFVALNLAHEIVMGKRTVEDARKQYVRLYKAYQKGEKPIYTQKLMFEVRHGGTADPDTAVLE